MWGWIAACGTRDCGPGKEAVDGHCVGGPGDDDDATQSFEPELALSPVAVSVGEVGVGCEATASVTLRNAGGRELAVSGLTATGDWTASATLPLSLAPGADAEVALSVVPSAGGSAPGTLTVTSNDPRGPQVVPLAAHAVWDSRTASHTVGRPRVDVVVSFDRSDTMPGEALDDVQVAFPRLIDALSATWDWNLALVTADDGCRNGGQFTAADPGVDQYLVDHVFDRSFPSNRTDALLELAARALSRSGAGQCNDGMLRPGAPLLLLMASDNSERSGIDAATWIATFEGFATPVVVGGAFDLNATCGDRSGGGGYVDAATATGGQMLNVCWAWGDRGNDLMRGVPDEPEATVAVPDAAATPTEVRIDGVPTTRWTYDAGLVTVTAPVSPGAVLEVDYPVPPACD